MVSETAMMTSMRSPKATVSSHTAWTQAFIDSGDCTTHPLPSSSQRQDRALCLGVGELEARDGEEDLARRDDDVLGDLEEDEDGVGRGHRPHRLRHRLQPPPFDPHELTCCREEVEETDLLPVATRS